jgi:hypothetical protein
MEATKAKNWAVEPQEEKRIKLKSVSAYAGHF